MGDLAFVGVGLMFGLPTGAALALAVVAAVHIVRRRRVQS